MRFMRFSERSLANYEGFVSFYFAVVHSGILCSAINWNCNKFRFIHGHGIRFVIVAI